MKSTEPRDHFSTLIARVLKSSQGGMVMQATLPLPGSVPVPMPTGSLEAYIQTVNRFPILRAEEERSLARRFREPGDVAAARQLVTPHLSLVVGVARGYLGYGLP